MARPQENQESLLKTAQLYHALYEKNCNLKVIKAILKREGDINKQLIGGTALHIAAHQDNIEFFDTLLKIGADFTVQNRDGNTILHYVIETIHPNKKFIYSILSAQIERKITTNPRNKKGMSHFLIACLTGNNQAVKYFLDNNVSVDEATNSDCHDLSGYTALHIAARFSRKHLLKLLLNRNANVCLKNAAGMTALDILIQEKFEKLDLLNTNEELTKNNFVKVIDDMIKFLLDGCNIDKLFPNDNKGLTYFQVACTMQDSSLAERLIEEIVDLDYQIEMNSPVWPGYSALHFAAHSNLKIVRILLDRGANPNIKDAKGVTPLDILLKILTCEKMLSIIELKESWKLTSFIDGKTNLFDLISAMSNPQSFEKYSKETSMDINTRLPPDFLLWPGYSILHLAVLLSNDTDHTLTLQCLDQGADVTAQDSRGRTPLILAFRLNKMETVNLLFLHHRVIVNPYDDECLSHLHVACEVKNTRLLKSHKDKEIQNINIAYKGQKTLGLVKPGYTPLHVAIANESVEMIRVLLNHQVDCQVKDADGLTPIDLFLYVYPTWSPESWKKLKWFIKWELDQDKDSGLTCLHFASHYSYEDILENLLEKKVKVDPVITCEYPSEFWSEYIGCTPLHLAIFTARWETKLIEALISNGADLLAMRPNGMTPIYDVLLGNCHEDTVKLIINMLYNDDNLLKKLKDLSGITKLHIACIYSGLAAFEDSVQEENVDVNARVNENCKIWPGYTALHFVLEKFDIRKDIVSYFARLFSKGADVTVKNANGDTPVHLAHMRKYANPLLLNSQKDFNINPVGSSGLSHFHIACMTNNYKIVKEFIEHGVDVNEPVDLFASEYAGKSPLDLAINEKNAAIFDVESLEESTVNLLLQNGAKTSCEDCHGNTVFHKAVWNVPLLEKLAKYETDDNNINKENIFGVTPLKLILQKKDIPIDSMNFFVSRGGRLNAYDSMSGENYIEYIASDNYHKEPQKKALEALSSTGIDEKGRNAIHHIVDMANLVISIDLYAKLFLKFDRAGIDVNLKDESGLTPLILATKHRNTFAVDALLKSGADINIVDRHGKTALVHASEIYKYRKSYEEVFVKLANHVKKLEVLNLEVSRLNQSTIEGSTERIKFLASNNVLRYLLRKELDEAKCFFVEPDLTLRAFISDYGPVADYALMVHAKRDRINDCLQSVINGEEFGELRGLLKIQYKKAIERMPLINPAIRAVRILFWLKRLHVPYECIVIVLGYMRNSDLVNLIDTMDRVVIKSDEVKRKLESDVESKMKYPRLRLLLSEK